MDSNFSFMGLQKLRLFVKPLHLLPFLYMWWQICAVYVPLLCATSVLGLQSPL